MAILGDISLIVRQIHNDLKGTNANSKNMKYGTVYYNDCDQCFDFQAIIWINGADLNTLTDSKGYFSLKIPAGLSTIKCTRINDRYNIIEEIEDLLILKNEKIELKIILGHVDE